MRVALLAALLAVLIGQPADARDRAVRQAFLRSHPCPATGKTHGTCPGYVVDHIRPLCAGGADAIANMQWQTAAEAKKKDRLERAECRRK